MKPLLSSLLFFSLLACDRATMHGEGSGSVQDNLSEIFGSCKENEIGFLARKFNIQLAFENCGSNEFSHFSWSPAEYCLFSIAQKNVFTPSRDNQNRSSFLL